MQPTVLGKKVELFLVDEKSDRIEAANAVSRLIQNNKVVAVLGSATSSNTMAGSAVAEKARIPVISPTATDPRVVQNKKFMFRVCFTDSFQGEVAAKYVFNNLKARKAAMLIDQAQDYSVDLGKIFAKSFTRLGGTVVLTTYCAPATRTSPPSWRALKRPMQMSCICRITTPKTLSSAGRLPKPV
jgi:branched-chain amino acid transport system substrate-binding protein